MEPNKASENAVVSHPGADAAGSPKDEHVAPWEEIEDGRYRPRRVRGSGHGRELG